MYPAVFIHNALPRINMHPGSTHVMPSSFKGARRRFAFEINLKSADAGAAKFSIKNFLCADDAPDVRSAYPPVKTDPCAIEDITFF
jgi:hypothetical protein